MISLNLQEHDRREEPSQKDATAAASKEAQPPQPNLSATAERLQIGLGNRYEILDPLAIGGMSTVFRMRHRLHGGYFVAKVLHPWLAEEPEFRSRFRAEAMHGVALAGHPHVLAVIDLGEIDGLFYMVMPFVDGEDLDHILQRTGRLERAEALVMLAQMNSVLVAAGEKGIVHCDIAPGNIRLDRFGMYRLMDFGIARGREVGAVKPKGRAWTPLYASPEMWRGDAPDARSDLYSLGVVLLEALSGVSPFAGASLDEIERRHVEGDWALPSELKEDAALSALIKRLLETSMEARMQSPFELAGALAGMGCPMPEFRERPMLEVAEEEKSMQRKRLSRIEG